MEDLGSAKGRPQKDQGILRVYLTQAIGCSGKVLTTITPRLVKCRTVHLMPPMKGFPLEFGIGVGVTRN